jgi:pSer/pThr/pTyr-binding forkhead associated (FHA) protein
VNAEPPSSSAPAPPSGSLILSVTKGEAAGTDIGVDQTLLIGRHASGIGELANDPDLSRRHALLSRSDDGAYAIEDLGSTNGTFVNGVRIAGATPVAGGDQIEVGNATLMVRQPQEPRPSPRVALRIEIDLAGRRASISLDDGSDRVDLVHQQGRWQISARG